MHSMFGRSPEQSGGCRVLRHRMPNIILTSAVFLNFAHLLPTASTSTAVPDIWGTIRHDTSDQGAGWSGSANGNRCADHACAIIHDSQPHAGGSGTALG